VEKSNMPDQPKYDPDIHRRRSLRLKKYDYSQTGAYFVTICTRNRERLFGDITEINSKTEVNEFGVIVHDEWLKSADVRKEITIDAFCIMPNHFHGIVVITGSVGAYGHTPLQRNNTFRSPSQNLGAMVRAFKSAVTIQINKIRSTPSMPIWQRNYYDHVIRDDDDLNRIREYIDNNPVNWMQDELFA
jgi:REP element-mobilizing transposase RayT